MYLNIIFILSYSLMCNCHLTLKWQDEFDNNKLNKTNWNVIDGMEVATGPKSEEVLSFSRESDTSIQLIDGVLALTAVQENYHGRKYTAATINSKMSFLYGRLDIRAALPKGTQLKSAISLLPTKNNSGRDKFNGEIQIVSDIQRDKYHTNILYSDNLKRGRETYPSSNDFQVYSLEWNETMITWSLNSTMKLKFDLDRRLDEVYERKGQPFDNRFYVSISLQVFKFTSDDLGNEESFHKNHKCPSLLIDYVRYYKKDNLSSNEVLLKTTSKTKEEICNVINDKLNLIYARGNSITKLVWFIIILICSIIIIVIISILVFVLVKRKRNTIENGEQEVYAEYLDIDFYDEPGKLKNYEYCDVGENENSYVTNLA